MEICLVSCNDFQPLNKLISTLEKQNPVIYSKKKNWQLCLLEIHCNEIQHRNFTNCQKLTIIGYVSLLRFALYLKIY